MATFASLEFRANSAGSICLKKALVQFHHVFKLVLAIAFAHQNSYSMHNRQNGIISGMSHLPFYLTVCHSFFLDVINSMIKNHLLMERIEFYITVPFRRVVLKEQELHRNCHLAASR